MKFGSRSFWLKWHWRVGIVAIVFLVILSVTGLVLNHSRALGLNNIMIEAPWALKAYNMELPDDYIRDTHEQGDQIIVDTEDGTLAFHVDTPDIPKAVEREFRGEGVSLERIILDAHSGKLIGISGTLITDLSALAILFLCASGFYNWRKRTRAAKGKS